MVTEGASTFTSVPTDVASMEGAQFQPFEVDLGAPEDTEDQSSEGTLSVVASSSD